MAVINTDIVFAKKLLEEGQLVAVPTETVYGLAANALNEKAVGLIFSVKNRPSYDPLIIHLYDHSQIENFCQNIPPIFYDLYNAFCPGPISFLLEKSASIPDQITAGSTKVAIRFPKNTLFRKLLKKLDFPVAAPSANPFGYISPTKAQHVEDQLGAKIELILDGGSSKIGLESTIIDLTTDPIKLLRLGAISKEDISEVINIGLEINKHSSSKPDAPGMLSSHYSPRKKLSTKSIDSLLHSYSKDQIACIRYKQLTKLIADDNQLILTPSGDINEAAFHFFDYLRVADQMPISIIHIEAIPTEGIGAAINDKIQRAIA